MVIPNIQEQLKKKKQPAGVVPVPQVSVAVPKKNIPQTASNLPKPVSPSIPAKVLPKMGGVPNAQKPPTTPAAPFVGGPLAAYNSPEAKAAREKSGLQPVDPIVNPGAPQNTNPTENGQVPSPENNGFAFSKESDKFNNPIFEKTSEAFSLANSEYKDPNEFAKELGLSTGPESIEDVVKQYKEKNKKEADFQKEINALEGGIESDSFKMEKDKGKSAIKATYANFAQGREGAVGSSAFKVAEGFDNRINQQMDIQTRAIQVNQLKRKKAEEDLADAQKRGDQSLAQSLMSDIARADQNIREAEARLGEVQNNAMDLSMKMEEQKANSKMKAFDVLAKSPAGSLAGQDPMAVAESFGVDTATASVLITMDTKKVALEARQMDMDEADYAIKMSEIQENIANAKFAGMTPEQKNFEYYKGMMYDDPAAAEEFALATGIKEKSFFADFQQQVQEAEVLYEKKGVKAPIKSKYAYDVTPDGAISFEKSAPAGKCIGKRSQCGEFVNDVINGGPGLMGDTYESKMAKVNSKSAVPGSAFVEKIGGVTGHTGIVEKTYPDGSFDIRESNYTHDAQGRPLISTAHIAVGSSRWKSIVENGGFYVPGASQAKDVETGGAQKAPVQEGQGGLLQKYAAAFASGEYEIDDLKAMGMSPSDIKMVTSAAFQMPKGGLNENYMTYAQAIASGSMDASELKDYGIKPNDIGMIAAAAMELKMQGGGGGGNEARSTAEVILGSGGAMTINDIPAESRAAVQAQINQLQNDPAYKQTGQNASIKAAQAIFNGSSTLTLAQLPQSMRIEVETELGKMRAQALKSGDIFGAMRATAGGKDVSETFMASFEKSASVISQVDQLAGLLTKGKKEAELYAKSQGVDASPFTAWWKKKNPWNEDAQGISAAINGIVPNLARGIFGEVGVLTDRDIEQYTKIVPNISQPETTQKVISALLLTNLKKSMENKIKTQIGANRDVSNYIAQYEEITMQLEDMNKSLGIQPKNTQPVTAGGTLSGLSALAKPFLGNDIYRPPTQNDQASPWDDIETDDTDDFLTNF